MAGMKYLIIIDFVGSILIIVAIVYLFILIVKALKKYINSKEVREAKAETVKTLGEVLKRYRTENKMTQEFVAETIGVSRQAISKWESGISDPSTSNMVALAKLFGVSPEELLKEIHN